MRTFFAFIAICLVTAVRAQTAPAPAPSASTTVNQNTVLLPPRSNLSLFYFRPEKPNEIRFNHVTLEGIFVHFAKPQNQLQLINPVAPPPYTSMDNVVLDPITQNVTGWKLFSISF